MSPAEIKQAVSAKVHDSMDRIVQGVYLKQVDSHNSFCGCDYCKILKEYVNMKMCIPKLNREMRRSYAYDGDLEMVIDETKNRVKELKKKKDNIKRAIIRELI